MTKREKWQPVKGYEGLYEVSNLGRVKRLYDEIIVEDAKHHRIYKKRIFEKILKQHSDAAGYMQVNLKGVRTRVHIIVADAFLVRKLEHQCVNHKDGNKQNNSVNNLEFCTFRENSIHAVRNNLLNPMLATEKVKRKVIMCDLQGNELKIFDSITDALKTIGKTKYTGNITDVCKGIKKTAFKHKWRYADEQEN